MDLNSIVEARIHPAIGVARVGNAEPGENGDDYFVGPEVPYPVEAPKGGYRDAEGRLKRQAARFRIYGYDGDGKIVCDLTDPKETFDQKVEIKWWVHVANKKAAWYNFDAALDIPEAASVRSPRRNAQIQGADRKSLVIDPKERRVSEQDKHQCFDTGEFFGKKVDLGEIDYEDGGSLLFRGGRGKSAPMSPQYTLTTFANNAGWHDDTSDGPVWATVLIGNHDIPVDSAWVVTAPPNYAPDLVATQPLYDVILDALGDMVSPVATPSFTRHILPIFQQFTDAQWVNDGFAAQFGSHGLIDFARPELLHMLATAPVKTPTGKIDPFQELRRRIFNSFRNPNYKVYDPDGWPPLYGDAFGVADNPPSPRVALAITPTSYQYLNRWMQGVFIADYNPNAPKRVQIKDLDLKDQPDALDHGALHFCLGGPFHPGCEMGWPMRRSSMYRTKLRLRQRNSNSKPTEPDYGDFMTPEIAKADGGPLSASGPGDVTKWMALPWQTDTASCLAGYVSTEFPGDLVPAFWPSRVPNTVLTQENYAIVTDPTQSDAARQAAFFQRQTWIQRLTPATPPLARLQSMIDHFHELGIVEYRYNELASQFPSVMYVETLPSANTAVRDEPGAPKIAP
jgi:hypothetical protein